MDLLLNLARGLQSAGGTLNPQVYQDNAQQQAQAAQQENALRNSVIGAAIQQRMQMNSPQYQAQMEALNNEKGFRSEMQNLGPSATEDDIAKAAVKWGKPEVAAQYAKAKEDRAARIQTVSDNLQLRKDALQQQKDLALQRAADQKERDAINNQFRMQSLALQQQTANLNAEMKRLGLTLQSQGLDIQRQKVEQAGAQQTQKQVQQLGTALEKANLPEADATIQKVEELLNKNPQLSEYISGPKSMIPDLLAGKEVTDARQAFQKLFNVTLKNRSGAAVTNQELARLKQEFGAGVFKTPEQLQQAVEQARNIINKHYASVASGFGKQALDAYNENARQVGANVVLGEKVGVPPPPPGFKVD